MVKTRSQSRAISDSFSSNSWTFIKTNEQSIADYIDDFERKLEMQKSRKVEPDWGLPGPFEVNFDFDSSISAWNANKKRVGHSYEYVCGHMLKNGKPCQNRCSHHLRCRLHKNFP
jgi:hypothetical protein